MRFTDVFIKRPVFASAISLLILLFGLHSMLNLQVRENPERTMPVVHVNTLYHGADAELIQGFITEPLEQAIAKVDHIDYISSQSEQGSSKIQVHMQLNSDPNDALTEVLAQVNSVSSKLPKSAEDPSIILMKSQQLSLMYIKFSSDILNTSQLTDYLEREIKPKFYTAEGVAQVKILGGAQYALRIWLDPQKMAALKLSAAKVNQVLRANNIQSAVGQANSYSTVMNGVAHTQVNDVEALKNLVVGQFNGDVIRLAHIADVSLEKSHDRVRILADGKEAVMLGVDMASKANALDVAKAVRTILPSIESSLPSAIRMSLLYDASKAMDESIDEVIHTILEATVIVILVILLFLGSLRAAIIPIVTIPLSLIGVCMILDMLGCTLNLMTLLAMVLAIGLVVDDAIVVVENIERHIQLGESPFRAAIIGTREIALPVLAMTITLAAVYAPMALMDGLTGSLFKEFALTLAGSVFISGLVALTLSPMMCSQVLRSHGAPSALQASIEKRLQRWTDAYILKLQSIMRHKRLMLLFACLTFAFLPILSSFLPSELAPKEDKSFLMMFSEAPSNVNLDYMQEHMSPVTDVMKGDERIAASLAIIGHPNPNQALSIVPLKPWSERSQNQTEIKHELGKHMSMLAGLKTSVIEPAPLPGSAGILPVAVVISTADSFPALFQNSMKVLVSMLKSPEFVYAKMDLKYDSVNLLLRIDKDKAGVYGIDMQSIGITLATFMGEGMVNRTSLDGRSYEVIPQAVRSHRDLPSKLQEYYVKAADGRFIPLSSLIEVEIDSAPRALTHFNQMHSATISAMLTPGTSMGAGVARVEALVDTLPSGYSYDFLANSRQYVKEGKGLYITFALALFVIFLVLASQFESWRDPWVILISVPLAISGAFVAMNWAYIINNITTLGIMSQWSESTMALLKSIKPVSMNIYSQVGLITLVGLITKHGILMCEVAKEQQIKYQKDREQAIMIAAKLRLRPILMTTAAMVAGIIPLLLAEGAGAAARFNMGFVIVSGLSIGTLFTLFVLPVVYTYIADQHRPLPHFMEAKPAF